MPEDATTTTSTGRQRARWLWAAGCVVAVLVVGAVLLFRRDEPVLADRIELPSGALAGWNVLLVSMDTVRRDRLGCYGRRQIDTPVLDALAREGIRFDQAITPVPMTLPGHAAMLTGLDPQHHGARVNGMFRLDEKVATLQGMLGKQGYRTGAVIGAFVLDRRFGLNRGFDHYDDDLSAGKTSYEFSFRERRADLINAAARAWLRKDADKRFFLFVHYFDPHWPYAAPEPFGSKYPDNDHGDYDGEIAYTDHQLGELLGILDELGVRDRTLIIVASDHGEGLGEHREETHSLLLYDTTLRVPLIVSGPPPLPRHRLVTRQVGLIDLAPTVLDLLGVPIPPGLDGISLLQPPPADPRALYIETLGTKFLHGWSPLVGVRREDVKLVLAPRSELFDLRADPNELDNLYSTDRATASALYETLKGMVGGDPELIHRVGSNLPMDEETREKLRQLGYVVTASAPTTTTPATQRRALPDPKDMIVVQRWVLQAQTLMAKGQDREALLLIKSYLEKHPYDGMALHVAGRCYAKLRMPGRSLKAYRLASQQPYERASAFAGIGTALVMQRKFDEAEAACRQALAIDKSCIAALLTLGSLRIEQKRDKEAMGCFQEVINQGRGTYDAEAYLGMYRLHVARGKAAQARQALDKALRASPNNREAITALAELAQTPEDKAAVMVRLRDVLEERLDPVLLLQLGRLQAEKGRLEQAADSLHRALELQSDNGKAHQALAGVLQKLGKGDEAMIHLREACRLRPRSVGALNELGLELARQNRLDEARNAFRRAVRLAPGSAMCRHNLGLVLARQRELPEAIEEFRQAIRLRPDYAEAYYNLGLALRMTGRSAEAEKCFHRAAELDPKLGRTTTSTLQNATR